MGEIDVGKLVERMRPHARREASRAALTLRRLFSGVSKKTQEQFFFQLSTMLASGVPIREALHTLAGQHGGRAGRVLAALAEEVGRGAPLSEALARRPEVFDRLARALARTGEMTGRLDENLALVGELVERFRRIRSRVITALLYPLVLGHLAVLIWNVPLLFSAGLGRYVVVCLSIFVPLYAAAAGASFLHLLLRQTMWYSAFILGMFVFGKVALKTALARFARALAGLYASGVNLDRAIETAAATTENGTLRATLAGACASVRRGVSLSEAFRELPYVPAMVKNMIRTGEHAGRLSDTLEKVAEYYEHESETTVQRLARIIPVFVYLMIMAAIAYQIIGFWLSRYSRLG